MIKQIQLFLSTEDEVAFTDAIRRVRPHLVVVDGSRWDTSLPPAVASIAACASSVALLWDQEIAERLPYLSRDDGRFDGPQAGLVLVVWRSRLSDGVLLSGRLAISTGAPDRNVAEAMDKFASDTWKVMKAITCPVVAIDRSSRTIVRDKVPEYRAGRHAAEWACANEDHLFRDRSAQVFFKPIP